MAFCPNKEETDETRNTTNQAGRDAFFSIIFAICCTGVIVFASVNAASDVGISIPTNPDANGWDMYDSEDGYRYYTNNEGQSVAFAYAHGGRYMTTDTATGFSEFTIDAGGSIINVTPLDVTKAITYEIEFTSVVGQYGDFYVVMYDSIEDMFFNLDGTVNPGFLSSSGNGNPVLKTHDGIGKPTEDAGAWEGFLRSSPYWVDVMGYTIDSEYAASPAGTCAINLNEKFTLKFEIAAEAGNSRMYFNDTLVATLNCVQSDFADGKVYLGMIASGGGSKTLKAKVSDGSSDGQEQAPEITLPELPVNPDANGWDKYNSTDGYSYYTDEAETQQRFALNNGAQNVKNVGNAFTQFYLPAGGSVINVTPLDVTKPIYFDIEISSIGELTYRDLYITMYDEIGDMFFNADGSLSKIGYLSDNGQANPILRMHEAVGNPTQDEGFWEGFLRSSPYWGDVTGYTIDSEYAASPAGMCAINLNEKFTLKIEIAEEAGNSKLYFNDTFVATLNFTRSDFKKGNAYVGFLTTGATDITVLSRVGQEETVTFGENIVVYDTRDQVVTQITARRGETVRFKTESAYIAKIGNISTTKDEDGYYTIEMPAGGGAIAFEEITSYFVTFVANGYADYVAEVSMDSPVLSSEVLEYIQETYKEDQYTVSWMNGDEEVDLSAEITGDMRLVCKFVENENFAIPDINGWDTKTGKNATAIPGMQTSEIYGAYHGELESKMDGTSSFVIEGAGYILNANRIDITRPFCFSYNEKLYHDTHDTAYVHWSLWESFTMGQVVDADGWKADSKGVLSVMYRAIPDSKVFDDFGVRKGFNVVPESTNLWKEELKVWDVYIGETAKDGYIKLNGVLVGQPTVTQSDFCAGYAYIYMMNFERMIYTDVSIIQSFNASIECDEHASYTIEEQKDEYSVYDFGEVYTLNVSVQKGYYLESITVNGEKVKLTDGKMKVYLAWGGSKIVIKTTDTLPVYTVTLRVRNQSSTVTVNMGEVFTPENAVLEGYEFLGWYLDSNFITEYVPTTLGEDITLYARMSKIVEEDPPVSDTEPSDEGTGCCGVVGSVSLMLCLTTIGTATLLCRKKKQ